MVEANPKLYVKPGCPWCQEAEEYLKKHNIAYDRLDVIADPAAFEEMRRISGQTKAPTLDWEGEVLADFGADELDDFLRHRNVVS